MSFLRSKLPVVITIAAITVTVVPVRHARAAEDTRITEASDKGVAFLLGEIDKQQMGNPGADGAGQVALETYALVVAGVSVNHPLLRRNFDMLRNSSLGHTYTVSCIIFALDAALSQIEADHFFSTGKRDGAPPGASSYMAPLIKAVNALVNLRKEGKGNWHYHAGGNSFDNSNTQFAVLGLGVGMKRRVPIAPEVWIEVANHFIGTHEQGGPEVSERVELLPPSELDKAEEVELVDRSPPKNSRRRKSGASKKKSRGGTTVVEKDGSGTIAKPIPTTEVAAKVFARGWNYESGGSNWNMTNAGLSSLILAHKALEQRIGGDFLAQLNKSIRDGYGWVIKNWGLGSGGWKYYGLYSLEKTADLGEVKKFGPHDWYEEVSSHIVGEQGGDGSWPGDAHMKRVNTAFALLVLNRATSLLTQRANRIVITGPGAHRDDDDRADWVYVQSLDREVHLPSLFRLLRLRPNPRLAAIVEEAVQQYPPEENGRLVPGLVKAHEHLTSPRFKRLAREQLTTIAGVEYENPETYGIWYRRWVKTVDLGTRKVRDRIPWLLHVYGKTRQSLPLREKIIWALMRCQAKDAAPMFIEDLGHRKPRIREAAFVALTTLVYTQPLPPFNSRGKTRARARQAKAITEWYERVSAGKPEPK